MNPINIKISNLSSQVSTNPPVGNAAPSQVNPIPLQPGSLGMGVHDQRNASGLKNKNQDFLSIAQDKNQPEYDRLKAAYKIDDHSLRDQAFLAIAQDPQLHYTSHFAAVSSMNDKIKQDQLWIAIAQDKNLKPSKRIDAALRLSSAHQKTTDDILLKFAEDSQLSKIKRWEVSDEILDRTKKDKGFFSIAMDTRLGIICKDAIRRIHDPLLKDQAWSYRAQDQSLSLQDRKEAAGDIHDTILRDKTWIQLYNDAMNLGEARPGLEDIINHIQDPDLQALAREALEAGEMVTLTSTKSARKA